MKFLKVNGSHDDFYNLCKRLEEFQYNLMPVLKEKGYNLTENLKDIVGYLMYDNERPIGSIGLKKVSDDTCEIVRVFVCEEYRGNGYAKLLFEKIEDLATTLGYKKAEMVAWVVAKSALKLYQRLDYVCSEVKESEWYAGLKYVELFKKL